MNRLTLDKINAIASRYGEPPTDEFDDPQHRLKWTRYRGLQDRLAVHAQWVAYPLCAGGTRRSYFMNVVIGDAWPWGGMINSTEEFEALEDAVQHRNEGLLKMRKLLAAAEVQEKTQDCTSGVALREMRGIDIDLPSGSISVHGDREGGTIPAIDEIMDGIKHVLE